MTFISKILPFIALAAVLPATSPCADPTTPATRSSQSQVIPGAIATTKDDIRAQQKALRDLGERPGAKADKLLLAQFERFRAGNLQPALWLELFEATGQRQNPALKALLAEREKKLAASHDPLIRYHECLEGGDAKAGREIFMKDVKAGCVRCHRVGAEGGQIGPDLTALHQTTDRLFILESIVDPNAVIAPGFQSVLLTLKSGESVSGILSFESEEEIVLTSVVDGKHRNIKAADIAERMPLPSAMPPGFGLILGKHAIRDLVEFIATAK